MSQHELVGDLEGPLKTCFVTSAELLLATHFPTLVSLSDLLHTIPSSSRHLEPNLKSESAIAWQTQWKPDWKKT